MEVYLALRNGYIKIIFIAIGCLFPYIFLGFLGQVMFPFLMDHIFM